MLFAFRALVLAAELEVSILSDGRESYRSQNLINLVSPVFLNPCL